MWCNLVGVENCVIFCFSSVSNFQISDKKVKLKNPGKTHLTNEASTLKFKFDILSACQHVDHVKLEKLKYFHVMINFIESTENDFNRVEFGPNL